jgi:hypothetical protein
MSRGISWRQRWLLQSALRAERQQSEYRKGDPIAWRDLDYGPGGELRDDYYGARHQWNIEQAKRRALRNLERRGLVELGAYSFSFMPAAAMVGSSLNILWICQGPDDHVPGQSRIMTGVLLTDEGRRLATR